MWYQIRDVTYDVGLRLMEGETAEEVLVRFLESRCRSVDGSIPSTGVEPFTLAHSNGSALANYGDERSFAAVPCPVERR